MTTGQFSAIIAGIAYPNDDGTNRSEILRKCTIGEKMVLAHTPIKQDKNAIKVTRNTGEQIGWIEASLAREIAIALDKGKQVTAEIMELGTDITKSGERILKCRVFVNKGN